MTKQIVVTRHQAYVDYLVEQNMVTGDFQVIPHATVEDIKDKHVLTSGIPFHLACECLKVTVVPLFTPEELRGCELTLEQVREYAKPAQTYSVKKH